MERAAKASKVIPPAAAARAPLPAPRPTAAAALQSRIGASGMHKVLARHGPGEQPVHARAGGHHDAARGAAPAHKAANEDAAPKGHKAPSGHGNSSGHGT